MLQTTPPCARLRPSAATYEHPQLEHLYQHTVMDSALFMIGLPKRMIRLRALITDQSRYSASSTALFVPMVAWRRWQYQPPCLAVLLSKKPRRHLENSHYQMCKHRHRKLQVLRHKAMLSNVKYGIIFSIISWGVCNRPR